MTDPYNRNNQPGLPHQGNGPSAGGYYNDQQEYYAPNQGQYSQPGHQEYYQPEVCHSLPYRDIAVTIIPLTTHSVRSPMTFNARVKLITAQALLRLTPTTNRDICSNRADIPPILATLATEAADKTWQRSTQASAGTRLILPRNSINSNHTRSSNSINISCQVNGQEKAPPITRGNLRDPHLHPHPRIPVKDPCQHPKEERKASGRRQLVQPAVAFWATSSVVGFWGRQGAHWLALLG